MKISIVVAASDNLVIGDNGRIPWFLPADLTKFRQITWGYPVIMGRKTYESIGKALPGRDNIVITKSGKKYPEITVAHSLLEAINIAQIIGKSEAMIIGGGQIYSLVLPIADRIYLTKVHITTKGDTYFPEIDMGRWKIISSEKHLPDEKNVYPYTFIILSPLV